MFRKNHRRVYVNLPHDYTEKDYQEIRKYAFEALLNEAKIDLPASSQVTRFVNFEFEIDEDLSSELILLYSAEIEWYEPVNKEKI